jgi:hypothetical protein
MAPPEIVLFSSVYSSRQDNANQKQESEFKYGYIANIMISESTTLT